MYSSITVLVPFYNEEKTLKHSVERLISTLGSTVKIFLIDDASTDKSNKIAYFISENNKNVRLFSNKVNSGKGSALMSTFNEITTTHFVVHDADLEYNPKDLYKMIKLIKNNPSSLILGSRFKGNEDRTNIYLRTRYANQLMSKLFTFVYKANVTDIATCYKIFPSEVLDYEFKERGFAIDLELVYRYLKFNNSILEIPIAYKGRSYELGKKIKLKDGFIWIFKIFYFRYLLVR
tara:strand:- start:8584 stop:9285 length:702 start_codon:yes stop_codon:yes gene_type:complete